MGVVAHHLDPHVRVRLVEVVQHGEDVGIEPAWVEDKPFGPESHRLQSRFGHHRQVARDCRVRQSERITTREEDLANRQ